MQVPVRIIFDDDDVVLAAEGVQFAAALKGEHARCWVLAHAMP